MMLALPGDDEAGAAQPGLAKGNTPQAGLFGDLLDRFTEIVGPAASEATFHYASLQEGMRLGSGHGPKELAAALARVDGVVGQRSRVLEDRAEAVRIAVAGSSLLASGNPVRQAVVRGLIEGMLRVVRGRPYTGRVVPPAAGATAAEVVIEFRAEAANAPS
ncbi:MAG: hypothetical protein ABR562_07405 [Thermoplasmatota archaeon]